MPKFILWEVKVPIKIQDERSITIYPDFCGTGLCKQEDTTTRWNHIGQIQQTHDAVDIDISG